MTVPSHLDQMMLDFDVRSAHQIIVNANLPDTYAALCAADFSQSPIIKILLWLRSFGRTQAAPTSLSLVERVKLGGFIPLVIEPEKELLFGIAGRFWLPTAERVPLDSVEGFLAFARDGYAKAVWSVSLGALSPDQTLLCTQTRVLCFGSMARARFRAYWTVIGPFSGLIRLAMLRQVRRSAESRLSGGPWA